MVVAAFVVSLLALLVSLGSAAYARRQAAAAAETARIERDRRHDELTPQFSVEVEQYLSSPLYWKMLLRLDSPRDLSALSVRLLNAPIDLTFTSGQEGTTPGARSPLHTAFAVPRNGVALSAHNHATWQLEVNDWPKNRLRLEVVAWDGEASWTVGVAVAVPLT